MSRISSPSSWFLRDKTSIAGLTKLGIKEISRHGITSLVLPKDKDGNIFDSISNSFYYCLERDAPGIIEICIPPEIVINVHYSDYHKDPYPIIDSVKRLIIGAIENRNYNFHPNIHNRFCFNDSLEYIEIVDDTNCMTKDGIVYSKNGSVIYHYPGSKKDPTYILPEEVCFIDNYAFSNTKYLRTLISHPALRSIAGHAFDNSSIKEFVTPSGTIKDNVPKEDAFLNCQFQVPKIVPAYTYSDAHDTILQILSKNGFGPEEVFNYLPTISDDIAEAFLNRMITDDNTLRIEKADNMIEEHRDTYGCDADASDRDVIETYLSEMCCTINYPYDLQERYWL